MSTCYQKYFPIDLPRCSIYKTFISRQTLYQSCNASKNSSSLSKQVLLPHFYISCCHCQFQTKSQNKLKFVRHEHAYMR